MISTFRHTLRLAFLACQLCAAAAWIHSSSFEINLRSIIPPLVTLQNYGNKNGLLHPAATQLYLTTSSRQQEENDIYQAFPPIYGPNDDLSNLPLLDGEEQLAAKKKNKLPYTQKPQARVRLFTLYGIADASSSMRSWASQAPDWCEVRPMELPGHGYLADTPLLPCAEQQTFDHLVSRGDLKHQFQIWVKSLADQIMACVVVNGSKSTTSTTTTIPYAIYGFSFGALIAYEIILELQQRRIHNPNIPLPILLVVAGRGAPHAMIHTPKMEQDMQTWDEAQMLAFGATLGFPTSTIAPNSPTSQRATALYRCGFLLSGIYNHNGEDEEATDTTKNLWDLSLDQVGTLPHAAHPSKLDDDCQLLSISGSNDTIWPPVLVERWSDITTSQTSSEFSCLDDMTHERLMNAAETKALVRDRLLTHCLQNAAAAAPPSGQFSESE